MIIVCIISIYFILWILLKIIVLYHKVVSKKEQFQVTSILNQTWY